MWRRFVNETVCTEKVFDTFNNDFFYSRMHVRERRPSLILFSIVLTNMTLHILNSSSSCFEWHTDGNNNWTKDVFLNIIILDMTCNWSESLISRHHLTSYVSNDTLTLFTDAPDYRKFDELQEKRIVVTSLTVHEHLFNYFLSIEQSSAEFFSLWRDVRSQDDEWCRHQASSGIDNVRTQHESKKRNSDKGFKFNLFFLGITSANVTKHAYECLKCILSLNILRERSWRYWQTYISISFMNICWDIVDSWWVFRIQEHEEIVRETCRCDLLLRRRFVTPRVLIEILWRRKIVVSSSEVRLSIKTQGRVDDVHEQNVSGYEKIERAGGHTVADFFLTTIWKVRSKTELRKSVLWLFARLLVRQFGCVLFVFSFVGLMEWLVVRLFVSVNVMLIFRVNYVTCVMYSLVWCTRFSTRILSWIWIEIRRFVTSQN